MSAAIPMFTSWMQKKASLVANLKSAAVAMSNPPPIQPPWIPHITGILSFSSLDKFSWSSIATLYRTSPDLALSGLLSFLVSPDPRVPKLARSMPAQKCFPVEDKIKTRREVSFFISSRTLGNSYQKFNVILLKSSPLLSFR